MQSEVQWDSWDYKFIELIRLLQQKGVFDSSLSAETIWRNADD